jgi:Asp-tRNA(Asn)/Glu-tRNA(Gln) amidotransferase A subunit family amidase
MFSLLFIYFKGIGTDIGGSIRVPSHFCGLYGFKPTGRRISKKGTEGGLFQESIADSAGPIARNMHDLLLLSKLLLGNQHIFDVDIAPLPFNETLFQSKKLRFVPRTTKFVDLGTM